jgi:ribosome maturation factor RimP
LAARDDKIREMLAPSVEDLGYELVDAEFHTAPGGGTLRLYIDSPDGIDIEACEKVSRQASALLDVEDPISGHYNLEVSSPGLNRVLRTQAHFAAFAGNEVSMILRRPIDGRRKLRGVLTGVDDDKIEVTVGETPVTVALAQIEKARLVPDYADLL